MKVSPQLYSVGDVFEAPDPKGKKQLTLVVRRGSRPENSKRPEISPVWLARYASGEVTLISEYTLRTRWSKTTPSS